MKNYKRLYWIGLLSFILCLVSIDLTSQDYIYPLDGINKVQISSETTIVLKSHDADTLLMKESENGRYIVPEKAKGLKTYSILGQDNTGYGVNVVKNESMLVVRGLRDRIAADMVIYLPKNMNVSLETLNNNDLSIDDFISEIEAKTNNGDIHIVNVTGPIIAESRIGEISIVFESLNQTSPISIIAINGDIDISLPEDANTDLTIKMPRGELYTDFEELIPDGQVSSKSERHTLKSILNGGGVQLLIQTLKGNVFLRKLK